MSTRGTPMSTKKRSALVLIATRTPGSCGACRHSNIGTPEFEAGRLVCGIERRAKSKEHRCDVTRTLPRTTRMDDPSTWSTYYLFEPFDGRNGTYGRSGELRIQAEDADEKLRASLEAHLPIIERC